MGNLRTHLADRLRCERGEVASWLILAAGLALATAMAAGVMGGVIGSLASRVAEAAEGQGVSSTTIERDASAGSEADGSGSPTPPEFQGPAGTDSEVNGSGNPTPEEFQRGPDTGEDPSGTESCSSFDRLLCSHSPTARDAWKMHRIYEHCAVLQPNIIMCNGFSPLFDVGVRTVLESELGAHPGDLFLAAANICDGGHPSCEMWTELAYFVFENREAIATTTLLGDILPGPRGVSCIPAFLDGAITAGEATECAVGIVTGVGVPIPSGVIDDALEGG